MLNGCSHDVRHSTMPVNLTAAYVADPIVFFKEDEWVYIVAFGVNGPSFRTVILALKLAAHCLARY